MVCDQAMDWDTQFSGVISSRRGKLKFFACRENPHTPHLPSSPISSYNETSDFPIKKALKRVFGLLTVRLLKRVSESILVRLNMKKGWQVL